MVFYFFRVYFVIIFVKQHFNIFNTKHSIGIFFNPLTAKAFLKKADFRLHQF